MDRWTAGAAVGVVLLAAALPGCQGEIGRGGPGRGEGPGDAPGPGDGPTTMIPDAPTACASPSQAFLWDLYAPVFSRCIGCHNDFGLARAYDLRFRLEFPGRPGWETRNAETLARLAGEDTAGGEPLLLAKPTGAVAHVGGQVLPPDSSEARLLGAFVDELREPSDCDASPPDAAADLVDALVLDGPRRTVTRAHFALTGEVLPPEARDLVPDTPEGLAAGVDAALAHTDFEVRLADAFADSLNVRAHSSIVFRFSQGPVLYRSGWRQLRFYNRLCEGEARNPCCHAPTQDCCSEYHPADYCESTHSEVNRRGTTDGFIEEPLELIKHVAREDLPVGEVVTADYGMVNPWSASIFGFPPDDRERLFDDDLSNDRWEYVPARIPSTELNDLPARQDGEPFYPHAGILSTTSLLGRYRSTPSNVHRGRAARVVLEELLAVPVTTFADFNTNEVPLDADLELATQEFPACTSCHAAMDPLGGFFRFHPGAGRYRPDRADLPAHIPDPSFLGTEPPPETNPLTTLGRAIADHPRYPLALVQTVLEGFVGVELLGVPARLEDPEFPAKVLAFRVQQRLIGEILGSLPPAERLTFREIVRAVVESPFFRAGGVNRPLSEVEEAALRHAGVGGRTWITPEQLTRKLQSVTGVEPASQPNSGGDVILAMNRFRLLLGGTDWNTVPERNREPDSVSVRLLERVANDFACRAVPRDFGVVDAARRRLFTEVEATTLPDGEGVERIRRQIQRLHRYLLGEELAAGDPEVQATLDLFTAVLETGQPLVESREASRQLPCRFRPDEEEEPGRVAVEEDPDFILRAWTAVLSYLLADPRFVIE